MQVDYSFTSLDAFLNFTRELHGKNMTTFQEAKSQYCQFVENAYNTLKTVIDPTPYIQYSLDLSKSLLDKTVEVTDPDYVVDEAYATWSKVASFGPGE